jgi:hypothetical protein
VGRNAHVYDQKLETKIAFLLKYTTTYKQEAITKLRQTMNEIGQRATARGLTLAIEIY